MTQTLKIAGLFVTVLVGLSAPAQAVPVNTLMQATYTGVVISGTDDSHIFGNANSLDGQAYTAIFRYDTAVGHQSTAILDQIIGGLAMGTRNPVIHASIRINGLSYDFSNLASGEVTYTDGKAVFHSAQDQGHNNGIYLAEYFDQFDVPVDLSATFTTTGSGLLPPGFARFGNGSAFLSVKSLQVATVSTVPLPAGLPLLASGVVAIGLIGRRRRNRINAG